MYLQNQGFVPIEDDLPIEQDWFVISNSAWPQEGSEGRFMQKEMWIHKNIYIGPTIYSIAHRAHFHANMIAPDIHTYASWGLWNQDFDRVSLWKKCSEDCVGCIWNMSLEKPTCSK